MAIAAYIVCIQAEDMIDYIRNAFKNNMYKLDWMNEETKKVAFEKVNCVQIAIFVKYKHKKAYTLISLQFYSCLFIIVILSSFILEE